MPLALSVRARLFVRLAPLLLAVLVAAAPARAEADILRVSFTARADGRGHVVRLHADGRVAAYSIDRPSPETLTLTIYQARVDPQIRRDDASGPVRNYRVEADGDRVVVTLTLSGGAEVHPQAYPDRATDDLLLSLSASAPVAAPVPTYTPPTHTTASPREPAPRGGTATAPTGASNWRLDCVVIDAGHGGHDAGAVANGVREEDVTLAIARRLGRMVEERLGMRVVYTRADDRFITLGGRGEIANASCGKLFISIHANSGASASAHGTETYFLAPHRTESARQVMERENDVVRMESDGDLYADFGNAGGIMGALAMGAYQEESQELAGLVETEIGRGLGRRTRGVKQAGFIVLWRASMPAILVETGFITNPDEARYLASSDGQEAIAGGIFRAVRTYKDSYERGLRLASGG